MRRTAPDYRPDIDGLRAAAVLAVVLFHAFPRAVPGGFAGVDVFFVISGYLITGILDRQRRDGSFSLSGFYARRVRRIFPALALVMTATLGYGAILLLPSERAALGREAASGAGFAANLLFWHEQGYFDSAAAAKPLLHLWSLGVEEQFYVAWPLLLWAAVRPGRPGLAWLAVVGATSFALNLWTAWHSAAADFYAPWTRLWELASGGWLALLTARPAGVWLGAPAGRAARDAASLLGLLLIAASAALLRPDLRYPGALALAPVAGAVLLLGAGPASLAGRALSGRAPVALGLVSYPLYLWHWPLLSYATILRRGRPPTPLLALCLLAAALALSVLTYRALERRVQSSRRPGTVAVLAGWVAAAGLAGLALAAGPSGGGNGRRGAPEVAQIDAAVGDGVFRTTSSMRVRRVDGLTLAELGQGGRPVLLAGDSLLMQYGPRLQRLQESGLLRRTVYVLAGPSCAPVPGATHPDRYATCSRMPALVQALVARHHIGTVILGAFWSSDYHDDGFILRHGGRIRTGTAEALQAVFANLADFVGALRQEGAGVWLILQPPTSPRFDPRGMIIRTLWGSHADAGSLAGAPASGLRAGMAATNQRLREVADRTGAHVLDSFEDVCGTEPVCASLLPDGAPKFADGMHLRPVFVRDRVRFLDGLLAGG